MELSCLLILFALESQDAFAQFGAYALVQDNVTGRFVNNGLLPQLNPPTAVAGCSGVFKPFGPVIGAPVTETDMQAYASPANGVVSTLVTVGANLSGGTAAATANISDTYFVNAIINDRIPSGNMAVFLQLGGTDTLECTDVSPPTCNNDFVENEVIIPDAGIRSIQGTPGIPCGGGGGAGECFHFNSPSVDGVGQTLLLFFPLNGCDFGPNCSCPSGPPICYYAAINLTLVSEASCSGFDTTCAAEADFSHTLQVTHADVVDASGNIIPGATVVTASGFNPNSNSPQQLAFSNFTGKLEITTGHFEFNGSFTLGSGSTGINPPASGLSLSVGNFATVVPKNSFVETSKSNFVYEGTINGVALQFNITPTSTTNTYSFKVDGSGASISTAMNPVPINVVVGPNYGGTKVNAQFQ